ncbi:MAG: hypothetical protein H7318_14010 [Oligoflexus sp.]|nr:hypothetical protein [Oligoflexus sp.]
MPNGLKIQQDASAHVNEDFWKHTADAAIGRLKAIAGADPKWKNSSSEDKLRKNMRKGRSVQFTSPTGSKLYLAEMRFMSNGSEDFYQGMATELDGKIKFIDDHLTSLSMIPWWSGDKVAYDKAFFSIKFLTHIFC